MKMSYLSQSPTIKVHHNMNSNIDKVEQCSIVDVFIKSNQQNS